MSKINKNLLNDSIKYSNLNGVAAHEEAVAKQIKEDLKDIKGLKFERDNLGSIAVIKKSKVKDAPTVSISTHMDEVGFMVTKIDKKGFIWFSPIGGWWGHVVLAQKFIITTYTGKEILGVVGSTPPHLLDAGSRKNVLGTDKMFLDLGFDSKEEVEKAGVQVGDMITPYQDTAVQSANPKRIIGKAHDNRISVVAGLEIMRTISDLELDVNVILVGTTQEEVGLRGARTSSFKWTPDIGFALDVTFCYNTPGMEAKDIKLGAGPALTMVDSYSIANKQLFNELKEVAKSNKIDITFESMLGGGTDAGAIQLAKDGVKAMTISIPSRYMHSHVSMIDLDDVQNTVNLFVGFLKTFNKKKLEGMNFK